LQVLIPLGPRRYRARVPEHLTAQLGKFNHSVALFEDGHSVGLGHDARHGSGRSLTELSVTENCRGRGGDGMILRQPSPNSVVNIANFANRPLPNLTQTKMNDFTFLALSKLQ
jgi:hypothetical protein